MDPQDQDRESASDRRVTNIFLAVMFVVIAGGGIWLAFALSDARKADECLATGRRNCAPIEVPAR
jgi:hypothetical protein